MTPIEIIALVLIVLGVLKILLLPGRTWLKIVKSIYSAPKTLFVIELVLAGIVLYYLFQAGFTIVEILAVVAFGALLTGLTFALYAKETISWADKIIRKDLLKKAWLPILIWLALLIWGFLELFSLI